MTAPLPSLDELPLHSLPGATFACEGGTDYDGRCPKCLTLARALPEPPTNVARLLERVDAT